MARQTNHEAQQERRRHVDQLTAEIKAAIASRAITGPETLHHWQIDELADELNGMRRHLRRTLADAFGRGEGEQLEASLFTGDLDSWTAELEELRIDRLAKRAVGLSTLVEQARAVLPEIEAGRERYCAERNAQLDAEHAAHVAEFKRRVSEENPRSLTYQNVVALLIEAGHDRPEQGSVEDIFTRASALGVITDLEGEIARRDHARTWSSTD